MGKKQSASFNTSLIVFVIVEKIVGKNTLNILFMQQEF
jgi:hypothetical protein